MKLLENRSLTVADALLCQPAKLTYASNRGATVRERLSKDYALLSGTEL